MNPINTNTSNCILYQSPDGRLGYSIFSTDMEAQQIQNELLTHGISIVGCTTTEKAIQQINPEQSSTNESYFRR